uniref:Solute carrier family 5 member 8 n=1 Tax=Entomoneis paludosa TaxID=265537 RepID=A0A7S2VEF1_9STRA|mmetsp:Transcript_18180/g.37580  ORF Transcript_18180/g.37580 Transcript_18180/m.37580 type:complete len:732 (+) Transcript_18180:216-2411(+)|eukprot:CAMPEP_0172445158 /NCGR_PEP_ID=MMETSP1065-20121228/5078_1 /TAXON_ID=265537 /ORGANISM="Amphiprora paludosa, Strain CCMP125" /LENGTH=731 /DNA_ID=CAMNT_0013195955 /DNA_START=154 /DNA_END=2349 /DNA_ORIENTATION=+
MFCKGFLLAAAASAMASIVNADCIKDQAINEFFEDLNGAPIPTEGSCCMFDVCGLECPKETSDPGKGFGIAVTISIVISFLIGLSTYFFVHGKSVNFFVAGRSLPLWIVTITLAAQSVDSNALLGNADLSYKYHFYDGAVIPIGLGMSLLINGIFLAHHINNEEVLTLPDIFAKRYGKTVEVLVSLCTVCSFIMLLAGNLVGFGAITSYLWDISEEAAIWIAAIVIWMYTATGGLFSVAYTDVVQGVIGWSGCVVMAFWFIANETEAPPPSIGFPGYIYPDNIGDGGTCDMYNGTACVETEGACCYNEALWCPKGLGECDRYDRGAYPFGDKRVFSDQMSNYLALAPFPNALLWNWATIFILGFGNLAALDFQARCMASKTPNTARIGCIIGGLLTFFIGIPFAYLGAITRVHYGPDAVVSEFETDTCAVQLGLPTCAQWNPDPKAFIKLLTHEAPEVLGAWCLIGIISASMSTADGAILAMGTVMSHNVVRQFDAWIPGLVTPDNLLLMARITTIPMTMVSAFLGSFYRSSHSAGATGYLLIVAFDIVLATVVVPLFGCFYAKNPSPRAALLAVVSGGLCRLILEFVLPKDGFLLIPYDVDEFLDYGPACSDLFPSFIDVNSTLHWDPNEQPCDQDHFEDFTGVDSLSSFLLAIIMFLGTQSIEYMKGGALFEFGGSGGYIKDTTEHPLAKESKSLRNVLEDAVEPTKEEGEDAVKDEPSAMPEEAPEEE